MVATGSYVFFVGTVFADGFEEGIGQHGIGRDSSHGMESKVTMKERIVVVCRLGAGCGGVVYKALDLSPLRLVALKVVPVHDRCATRRKNETSHPPHY